MSIELTGFVEVKLRDNTLKYLLNSSRLKRKIVEILGTVTGSMSACMFIATTKMGSV